MLGVGTSTYEGNDTCVISQEKCLRQPVRNVCKDCPSMADGWNWLFRWLRELQLTYRCSFSLPSLWICREAGSWWWFGSERQEGLPRPSRKHWTSRFHFKTYSAPLPEKTHFLLEVRLSNCSHRIQSSGVENTAFLIDISTSKNTMWSSHESIKLGILFFFLNFMQFRKQWFWKLSTSEHFLPMSPVFTVGHRRKAAMSFNGVVWISVCFRPSRIPRTSWTNGYER